MKSAATRVYEIDARPEPIAFVPQKTAVIVVDMQNDFGKEGGMFHLAGIDISGIQTVVQPTARVIETARKHGILVVYLKMAYKPDLSDFGEPGTVNRDRHKRLSVGKQVTTPNGSTGQILIRDTWNTAVIDELKPQEGDIEIYKTRYSGFYKTELDDVLRSRGITHLIITGCTTSICVDSTVRDANFRDYSPILLEDCMDEPIGSDLQRSNHASTLLTVEIQLGWVSDSTKFIEALS